MSMMLESKLINIVSRLEEKEIKKMYSLMQLVVNKERLEEIEKDVEYRPSGNTWQKKLVAQKNEDKKKDKPRKYPSFWLDG